MTLSNSLIRLLLLALPGIVGSLLYRKLKGRTATKKDWEDFLEIGIFSLLSYTTYYVLLLIFNFFASHNEAFTAYQALFDEKLPIAGHEVILTSLVGILLSFLGSFIHTHKLINKLGRHIKVTRKFGDEDVWDFFHNMPDVEWVFVRDHKFDLVY